MKYRNRRALTRIILLLWGITCLPSLAPGQTADTGTRTKQQFQEIVSKLDLGGDMLLVMNTDGIVSRFMDSAIATDVGIPADSPDEKEIRDTIERFRTFLNRNGFSAMHGGGISAIQREDGLHTIKMFISRDYIESNLPLWRGLIGWQPRRLLSLDFIPADAVMTRAGTSEPASLWRLLESAVSEVAPEASRTRFNAWKEKATTALGVPVADLVASLRDESLVAIRFSDSEECVIPSGGELVTIPAPSILCVVGVNDDMLRGIIEASLAKRRIPITESRVGDTIIRSASQKIPSLIPMQPSYASQAGFFIFGTSPQIVEDALLAYRHKNGLLARPEFKQAFQGVSMVNNGIVYVSPEMGHIVGHVRAAGLDRLLAGTENHPATTRMLRQLFTAGGQDQSLALTIQNWKKGVMVMGPSAWGGKDFLTRLLSSPARLLTALLTASKPADAGRSRLPGATETSSDATPVMPAN
jgi:hypothetical protein